MNVLVIVGQAHRAQCGIAPLVLLRTGTGIAAVRGHAVQNSTIDAIMHWAVRVRAVQNRPTPNAPFEPILILATLKGRRVIPARLCHVLHLSDVRQGLSLAIYHNFCADFQSAEGYQGLFRE